MRRIFWAYIRSRHASAATEFALVTPILLLLVGGIVEFGFAFQAFNGANRLATQYALAWADCSDFPSGTCQTEISGYTNTNAVANIVPQLVPSRLTLRMFQLSMNGSTPAVIYAYPVAATLTAAETNAAQSAFSDKQTGVLVSVSYDHSLQFFSALMGPYLASGLTAQYTVTQLKG